MNILKYVIKHLMKVKYVTINVNKTIYQSLNKKMKNIVQLKKKH